MKKISVVVPFLNEQENLPEFYRRMKAVFDSLNVSLELIFVDDGSSDNGPAWVKSRQSEDPSVRLIQLSRNFGHQIAITAGMDRSRGDAVVIIDADLQDPPEVIPELIDQWEEGHEVVYAVRQQREGETWSKKFLAAAFYKLFRKMASIDVPMNTGDFRLVDRRVVEALSEVRELHRFMRGLTCWVGFRQVAVYYKRDARFAGVTKYPVLKSLNLAWDALTSFSGKPLRAMSALGIAACGIGLLWFVRIMAGKIFNPMGPERGWPSVMAAILFMGGIQLLSVGLLGQYLSRTYEETKKRPLYIVRSDTEETETE